MQSLYIETRCLKVHSSLSGDVAHHMLSRRLHGSIAIIAERPTSFLASIKKEWLKETRRILSDRARILETSRILELTDEIAHMKALTFSARSPLMDIQANVNLSTAEEYKITPPKCATLYITHRVNEEDIHMITSWMPPHSRVVIYKIAS
jgi:hypothetical protein